MGCFQSKKMSPNTNIFRVVNIDENRAHLWPGQLEITTSDIILYRDGREPTLWPLHTLRRYGFEGEIFSFESGRRCETGEGIYAFQSRKASFIFQILQQRIQARNDSVTYPVSRHTPSPQGRPTLQASVVHRSSIDNDQPSNPAPGFNSISADIVSHTVLRPENQTPRSPSNTDILEVMPLYPISQSSSSHVSNVYQLRDFKREHNNNQAELVTDATHMYTNDFNKDLAKLRITLKQLSNSSCDLEDESLFLEAKTARTVFNDSENKTLSPTLSHSSEHYAQLVIEQPSRLYVNVSQSENYILENQNEHVPTTPLTPIPKQIEYYNLPICMKSELNTYANLMLGETTVNVKNIRHGFNSIEQGHKFSESDTVTSMSPVEELEVNYAILDIDSNNDVMKTVRDVASPESQSYNSSKNESTASCSSRQRNNVVSQPSIDRSQVMSTANPTASTSIGYTTIDFDKTVALTSVAAGTEVIMESCRKARQNSCNMFGGSPVSSDKNRGNN